MSIAKNAKITELFFFCTHTTLFTIEKHPKVLFCQRCFKMCARGLFVRTVSAQNVALFLEYAKLQIELLDKLLV